MYAQDVSSHPSFVVLAGGNDSPSASNAGDSSSNLSRISQAKVPEPKVKSGLKVMKEVCEIAFHWAKIGVNSATNAVFGSRFFAIEQQEYSNPITLSRLHESIAAADTLNLGLDFLNAVKRKDTHSIQQLQKQLTQDVCHGPASDFLLDLVNYAIQESANPKSRTALLALLPQEHKSFVQAFFTTMDTSLGSYAVQNFSKQHTRKQQIKILEKVNERPLKMFHVPSKASQKMLDQIQKMPELNTALDMLIKGSDKVNNNSSGGNTKIPDHSVEEMMPHLMSMMENSAEILDVYQRASKTKDPVEAGDLRTQVALKMQQTLATNPDYLPAFHYLVDAIVRRGQDLRRAAPTGAPAANQIRLQDTRLHNLAKQVMPHMPDQKIADMIDSFCGTYAAPLEAFQKVNNRLSLQDEQGMLFTALQGQTPFIQGAMQLLLSGVKAAVIGQAPSGEYQKTQSLEHGFDVQAGVEFAYDLIDKSDSPEDLKAVFQSEKHLKFVRNLVSQSDFKAAFAEFAAMLPDAFGESLQTVFEQYHLESMSLVGKHMMPHIDDKELRMIVDRLPMSFFRSMQAKADLVIQFSGDRDNNLITALGHKKAKALDKFEQVLLEGGADFKRLLEADASEGAFENLLKQAQVHTTKKGEVIPHRLVTLKAAHQKVVNANFPAEKYEALSTLLADMSIPLDLSSTLELNKMLRDDDIPLAHNLKVLRAAVADYYLSDNIQSLAQLLLPVGSDAVGLDPSDSSYLPVGKRKLLLKEFLKSITTGMSIHNMPATREAIGAAAANDVNRIELSESVTPNVVDRESVDMLWDLTKQLIASTDRTVEFRDGEVLPGRPGQYFELKNAQGQTSEIMFMEDGSCVDVEGSLLPKGDPKNTALREMYHEFLEPSLNDKQQAARDNMQGLMKDQFPKLVKLLSDYPEDKAFRSLLDSAKLPKDVQNLLVNFLDQLLPQDLRESILGQYATVGLQQVDCERLADIVDRLPNSLLDGFADQVTRLINDLDPYVQMDFFKVFANQLTNSLGANKAVQSVADVLTRGYYKEVCHADKRKLAMGILQIGCPEITENGEIAPESMNKLVNAMTQGGGPGFQKAMQLFKNDIAVPSIRDALAKMDDGVDEMKEAVSVAIIEKDLLNMTLPGTDFPKYQRVDITTYPKFKETDGEPKTEKELKEEGWPSIAEVKKNQHKCLGSATIGQTHLTYLWQMELNPNGDGVIPVSNQAPKKVVVKLQRPCIAHRIHREMNALKRIPNISDSEIQTLEELKNSMIGETDFSREFQFGRIMNQMYSPRYTLSNDKNQPVQVADMIDHGQQTLIQGFVQGKKITSLWEEKSAEYGVHFPSKTREVVDQGDLNPNRIEVFRNEENYIVGLDIIRSGELYRYDLDQNSPLATYLHSVSGNTANYVPSSFESREIVQGIQKYFGTAPLSTQKQGQNIIASLDSVFPTIKGSVDFVQQADFLKLSGDRLSSLVSRFANSAFLGVDYSDSFEFSAVSPDSPWVSENKSKTLFISEDIRNAQPVWVIRQFNTDGSEKKSWAFGKAGSQESGQVSDPKKAFAALLSAKLQGGQTTWQSALDKMPLQEAGEFNKLAREALGESFLFDGESFIDSDRHDGNLMLLENKENYSATPLVCIDTGAGTVVTQYERDGMMLLGEGMLANSADIVIDGLKQVIPNLDDLMKKNDQTKPDKAEGWSLTKLKKELQESLDGLQIESEKHQALYLYMMKQNMVDGNQSAQEFFAPLVSGDPRIPAKLRSDIVNFQNQAQAVSAMQEYFECLGLKGFDYRKGQDFMVFLEGFDFGRLMKNGTRAILNPKNLTDGHNALLFINSVRNIANVLNGNNIPAPECIIQLNRGSKFIEDQLNAVNQWKGELEQRVDTIDSANKHKAQESKQPYTAIMTNDMRKKLKPMNLGWAYALGLVGSKVARNMFGAAWRSGNTLSTIGGFARWLFSRNKSYK